MRGYLVETGSMLTRIVSHVELNSWIVKQLPGTRFGGLIATH